MCPFLPTAHMKNKLERKYSEKRQTATNKRFLKKSRIKSDTEWFEDKDLHLQIGGCISKNHKLSNMCITLLSYRFFKYFYLKRYFQGESIALGIMCNLGYPFQGKVRLVSYLVSQLVSQLLVFHLYHHYRNCVTVQLPLKIKALNILFWNNCRVTQICRSSTEERSVPFTQLTPMATSFIIIVQY